jgi:glycosyltransferase involved in cell wall biosynthesis
MPILSIIIPVYNEEKTLETILKKIVRLRLPRSFKKEIIVINDNSTDSSFKIIRKFKSENLRYYSNKKNLGKSQSVKIGILKSKGDFVVIQDADLEYNPNNIVDILSSVIKNHAHVGYGNRFGKYNGVIYSKNFYGNLLLSMCSNLFTVHKIRVIIPDMEVCYKLIQGDIARKIALTISSKSNFGFEPEITAKLSQYKIEDNHLSFIIYPVDYSPRSITDGKKMKAYSDGLKALTEILKYNLFPTKLN